jgi:hypothetical protein
MPSASGVMACSARIATEGSVATASAFGQGAGAGGEAAKVLHAPTSPPMMVMTNALVPASRPPSVPHTDIAASERGAMRRRVRARLAQQLRARTVGQSTLPAHTGSNFWAASPPAHPLGGLNRCCGAT